MIETEAENAVFCGLWLLTPNHLDAQTCFWCSPSNVNQDMVVFGLWQLFGCLEGNERNLFGEGCPILR